MKIDLQTSSIGPMLDFLRSARGGTAREQHIRAILDHPDYDFEFRRYGIASKDPLIAYFMNLRTIPLDGIPIASAERRTMFRDKHERWLEALDQPDAYASMLDAIQTRITAEELDRISALVQRGLPAHVDVGTIRILSTMSIGTSFGYVFDGAMHFDLMGLREHGLDAFPPLLAHEIHHLAMWPYVSTFIDDLTLEERYIFTFSGEGLAIKFANNAQGTRSRAIDAARPANEGLDAFSMAYGNARFEESYAVFRDTLAAIRAGTMGEEDVFRQIESYWWNPYAHDQSRDAPPALKQSRIYTFGNDLYGSIYDAHGPDVLFDCVRHPLRAVALFERIAGS